MASVVSFNHESLEKIANMFTKFLCLLGPSLALLPFDSYATASGPSVTLEAGVIVNQFLGVPFAAKPVRFSMPEPPCKRRNPLKTTKQAPSCLQQFIYPAAERDVLIRVYDTPPPPAGETEDCLYLDVYVPTTATINKTVMFFLFGVFHRLDPNSWFITDDSDQISAIYTDVVYQCPVSIAVNDSLSAGIPTWRYLYNATFPNIQPLTGLGVYHGSQVPLIFGNLPTPSNASAFEMTLSKYMQTVWADFVMNPPGGPPWPKYPSVAVLGTMDQAVTMVPAAELDTRCPFLNPCLGLVPS